MRAPTKRLTLAAVASALAVGSVLPAAGATGTTARVSVTDDGRQTNADTPARSVPDTTSPALSLDGRWLAFSSDASNLVPGDTNGVADVFVRDMATRRVVRISVPAAGGQANGGSYSPALSVDGTFIAFASAASNLVPGDTNGVADLFLFNRRSGSLRRISVSTGGAQANGASNTPFVSLFGDWIAFESEASNLHGRDTNGRPDAFLLRRRGSRTTRIAAPPLDREDAGRFDTWTARPTISYDGRYVAFLRRAASGDMALESARALIPDEPQPMPGVPSVPGAPPVPASPTEAAAYEDLQAADLFVTDRRKGRTKMVSFPKWNARFRVLADRPQISADGRRIVFEAQSVLDAEAVLALTDAGSQVTGPDDTLATNELDERDVWLHDHFANVTISITRNVYGLPANGHSGSPQISSQGHTVVFVSEASNLVPGDDNGMADVFAYDTRERAVSRVSVGDGAAQANGASIGVSMDYDGRHIVFASAASNLDRGDTNNRIDLFHHDRRIDIRNRGPNLWRPFKGVTSLVVGGGEHTLTLRARDRDDDPLRYGILLVIPPSGISRTLSDPATGAAQTYSLDPRTGEFRWRPSPNQEGPWIFAFWVTDARGAADYEIAQYVVRNPAGASLCSVRGDC